MLPRKISHFIFVGTLALVHAAAAGNEPVRDFSLPSATDRSLIRLSDHHGKVVLINWWRTSCGYCQRETPKLVDLYKTYKGQGLEIIGISDDSRDTVDDVPDFLKKSGVTWPVGLNDQGEFVREIRPKGSGSTPCNYLVSRSGKCVFLGLVRDPEKDWGKVEDAIRQALSEPESVEAAVRPRTLKAAPNFQLEDLTGKRYQLRDYARRPLVVAFYTSGTADWAGPVYTKLHKEFASRGLQVVGVNLDEDEGAIKSYVAKYGVDYPVLKGDRKMQQAWVGSKSWATVFVSRDGKILKTIANSVVDGMEEVVFRKYAEYLLNMPVTGDQPAASVVASVPSESTDERSVAKDQATQVQESAEQQESAAQARTSTKRATVAETQLNTSVGKSAVLAKPKSSRPTAKSKESAPSLTIEKDSGRTGIELLAGSQDMPQLERWNVRDASGDTFASSDKWEFLELPSGKYVVSLLPKGYDAQEITWEEIVLSDGDSASVRVDSGVTLSPRTASDASLEDWYVYAVGLDKPVASIHQRWGFTPLPPGDYVLQLKPRGNNAVEIPWQEFSVDKAEVETIKVDSGIEVLGRHGGEQPEDWYVYAAGVDKLVARVYQRWGFTPLPPGDYVLQLKPAASNSVEIRWRGFSVAKAKVETIKINSGITLSGHTPRDQAHEAWHVYAKGSKQLLARVNGRWGFTPLPPGAYDIYLKPGKRGSSSLRWRDDIAVKAKQITEVAVTSGIELIAPAAYHTPPNSWKVFDAASRQLVTEVSAGWCLTPLRPGDYYVQLKYEDHEGKSEVLSIKRDEVTEVTLANVGIPVEEPPVEQRTGIAFWGASKYESPPDAWYVYDVATDEKVSQVGEYNGAWYAGRRWGFTLLKPGKYRVSLLPHDSGAVEHLWNEVTVVAGKVAELHVDSGIELVAGNEDYPPPAVWYVYDLATDEKVAQVGKYNGAWYAGRRWGFTPLKPGKYRVSLLPHEPGAIEQNWGAVTVRPGQTETIQVGSGVELVAGEEDLAAPNFWTVHDAATGVKVAQVGKHNGAWYVGSRWGFTPLPPGEYRVAAPYEEVNGESASFKIEANQVKRMTLGDLGIARVNIELPATKQVRLASGSEEVVVDIVARATLQSWKKAAQRAEMSLAEYCRLSVNGKYKGLLRRFEVPSDLRLGAFVDEGRETTTERKGHKNLPPGYWVYSYPNWYIWQSEVKPEESRDRFSTKVTWDPEQTHVNRWLNFAGDVTVIIRSGDLVLENPVDLVGGRTNHIPFDPETLAKRHELTWFQLASEEVARTTVMNRDGNRVLSVEQHAPAEASWLAPAGALVRTQNDTFEAIHRKLPTGQLVRVGMDEGKLSNEPSIGSVQVDVVIQRPVDGQTVLDDRVTVTGIASTTGPAGATKILLVMDASGSVLDTGCGADLDGDGKEDNILQAEVLAARKLLDELDEVERSGPGTAFEVGIVRFGSSADVVAPLTRLTVPNSLDKLNQAIDQVLEEDRGGTNYPAAIEEATKVLRQAKLAGPAAIVFMTDGMPLVSRGRGSYRPIRESLNAAGMAGLAGVDIHMIGLGKDFQELIKPQIIFPPEPADGANLMATLAATGAHGSTARALPRPADVVDIVAALPILQLPDAELKELHVVNETAGKDAFKVDLQRDGSFQAEVPVHLIQHGGPERNTLVATAIALDGSSATDDVWVKGGVPPKAKLRVVQQTGAALPAALMPAVELILDSSGSMQEAVQGQQKSEVARQITATVLAKMPANRQVGLRLFGHWGRWVGRISDPKAGSVPQDDPRMNKDSQLVVSIGPLTEKQRQRITTWLNWAKPRGKTPLVYSLLEAKNDFPSGLQGARTIVLVSDGQETCGGNLTDVTAAYKDAGIDVTIHVVGFDVEKDVEATNQLKRIAESGGGKYFSAKNARQLAVALGQAVSLGFVVKDATTQQQVASGIVNEVPIELDAGEYYVEVNGLPDRFPLELKPATEIELSLNNQGQLEPVGE